MFSRFVRPAMVALCLSATSALAGPTTLEITAPDLFANGSSNATISYLPSGLNERVAAGQFNLVAKDTATGVVSSLQVFCTDIFDNLKVPATYTVGLLSDTLSNAVKVAQIAALLTNGRVTSAATSAGLQLAIWEVQNEAGTTAYNLSSGDFRASDLDAAALDAANADLAHINDGSWAARSGTVVRQISTPGSQRLSYLAAAQSEQATAVPEPADTLVLVSTGLLLLTFRMRRNRS